MTLDIPSGRRDAILARLAAGQPVRSGALAAEFGLSEDAIRRDLRGLAAEGLCRRVYGGALPLVDKASPMALRAEQGVDDKRALAAAAIPLITPGSFLFLDSGSTNLALAAALPRDLDVTVATNSVAIAAALAAREDIDLMWVGGALDRMVGGTVDGSALEAVSRLNVDLCFLGACALSSAGGVSAVEPADATFKRALTRRSREAIVLVTTDKLGQTAPHRIVGVEALARVIVEADAPVEIVQELEAAGAMVVRAAAPTTGRTG